MDKWFERSERYKDVIDHLGITESSYLSLVDSIKRAFPETWVLEEVARYDRRYPPVIGVDLLPGRSSRLQYNPVAMTLGVICGGDIALVHLIRLGQLIQAAEDEPGGKRLIKKLRGRPDDYISARFEMEVLERFKRSKYSLKKPMEQDGVDFTFEKSQREVFVEATHRGASETQDLADKISNRSFKRGFQKPSNRDITLMLRRRYDYYTDAVIEEIVSERIGVINSKQIMQHKRSYLLDSFLPRSV